MSKTRPWSKFTAEETKKLTGDNMKIQRDDLKNILHWFKNFYSWLTQKQINGSVIFKCQKDILNITLAIEAENRTENTNHQMNNTVKFTQRSHSKSLWTNCLVWFYKTRASLSKDSYSQYHTTWETNRYAKQLTSLGVLYHFKLLKIKI